MKKYLVSLKVIALALIVSTMVVNLSVAHPQLRNFGADSFPKPGSIVKLSEMPDQITLVFNEEIMQRSYMVLERNQGAKFADLGDPIVDLNVSERNVMRVTVNKDIIEPGTYTVHYIVYSEEDSGITVGRYNFAIVAD